MRWFSSLFPKPVVLHSSINGPITLKKRYGNQAVLTGEITQSGGEFVFMWKKLFTQLKQRRTKIVNCLVLGVGGGTSIQILQQFFPNASITGVELDPVMLEIATNYFAVGKSNAVTLQEADACAWVRKRHTTKYDLIIVDLYIGVLNAPCSREKAFLLQVKKLLSPRGKILYNVHYQKQNIDEYPDFLTLCQSVFSEVEEVFIFPLNRILLLRS